MVAHDATLVREKKASRAGSSGGWAKHLGHEDRVLIDRLLEAPVDFMNHPAFGDVDIEVRLFGAPARMAPGEWGRFCDAKPVMLKERATPGLPTLTTPEEERAFMRYNYARCQCARLLAEGPVESMTKARFGRLLAWARRAQEGRSFIAKVNMPLVLAMAKRTRLASVDPTELISEGNMALLRSIEKFDCSKGFKFSTYACRAILKSFSRVAIRLSRYRQVFPTEFDPSIEQSDQVDHKREGVKQDCLEEIRRILIDNTAGLSDVERRVIVERFALDGSQRSDGLSTKVKTLEQVGQIIGVTKERVRQIQNKALNKLRLALQEGYLAA